MIVSGHIVKGSVLNGHLSGFRNTGGGAAWELGQTMKLVHNVLDVNMTDEVVEDKRLPVSSKAVYTEVEGLRQEKQDVIVVQYDQEAETLEVQL